jgi:sialic acid synthase SpsE
MYRDIYKKYQMPAQWLKRLHNYCDDRIEFMATCFLPEDVETISPFVNRFKVSAFESGDRELLQAVCNIAEQRILLMSVNTLRDNPYLDHIVKTEALQVRARHGIDDVLMYCVTAYPAPLSRIDLSQLQEAANNGLKVGFSDHTGDIDMGAYAVCAGATYIEAHCKLMTTDHANPDAGTFAHSPASLKQYVQNIRKAEVVMSQAGRPLLAETRLSRYRVIR